MWAASKIPNGYRRGGIVQAVCSCIGGWFIHDKSSKGVHDAHCILQNVVVGAALLLTRTDMSITHQEKAGKKQSDNRM